MIIQPIFVLGVAHSGTTIFYNMMAYHPDLAWFSQYSQRDGSIPGRFYVPGEAVLNRGLRALFKHRWQKRKGLRRHIIPHPREADKIWDYILPIQRDTLFAEDVREKLNSVAFRELKRWRKNALLFKLPRLSTEFPLLLEIFPQEKFIHIIRDGRAVALSNRHKFLRSEPDELKALSLSANHWKRIVTKLQHEKLAGINILEIKYEDFCNDVHGYISECLKLADLDGQKMPWSRFPGRLTPTNDKWIENCTGEEAELLNRILGSTLAEFNYTQHGHK